MPDEFQIGKSKPFIVVAAIAVLALVAAAVAFNAVQDVYEGTDVAQLQADFDNHKFMIDRDIASIMEAVALMDEDHHDELNAISRNFTSIANTLTTHGTAIIVLNQAAQLTPPPAITGTADYDLKTINIQTFQLTTEFPRHMPVYITGSYGGLDNTVQYSVTRDGAFVKSASTGITTGTFTFAYNVDGTAEIGDYVVTVIIDNKRDTVSFRIE